MEPSLVGGLVFEYDEKMKIQFIRILTLVIENLDAKNWIKGLEVEKLEK